MRILITTGGSEHSDQAVRLGGALAATIDASITLLTVVPGEGERTTGEALLERAVAQLPAGITPSAHSLVRVGDKVAQIVSEAGQGGYDLIVVGERVQHSLRARVLSPTSERIIAQAHCPVLIAKGMSTRFNRLLLCDSGIETGPLMERFASNFPALLTDETTITVLHVMSQIGAAPGVRGWQLRADAEQLMAAHTPEGQILAHDLAVLEQSRAHPAPKVRHGGVVEEIIAESNCEDYDMVVIGAHRNEGWQRLLLDNLAHQLISRVTRPLLVIQTEELP